MPSMIVWGIAFMIGLVVLLLTSAARMPILHLSVSILICLGIAFIAIVEQRQLRAASATESKIAAASARNMGFIYIWGAIVIAITYTTLFSWHEWWHWFIGFALVGTACIFFSNVLRRDASEGTQDETMLSIGNKLTWAQLVGMLIAIVGMLVDGKLQRYVNPKAMDWAAQNTFFSGAIGLAVLSAFVLWAAREARPSTTA